MAHAGQSCEGVCLAAFHIFPALFTKRESSKLPTEVAQKDAGKARGGKSGKEEKRDTWKLVASKIFKYLFACRCDYSMCVRECRCVRVHKS